MPKKIYISHKIYIIKKGFQKSSHSNSHIFSSVLQIEISLELITDHQSKILLELIDKKAHHSYDFIRKKRISHLPTYLWQRPNYNLNQKQRIIKQFGWHFVIICLLCETIFSPPLFTKAVFIKPVFMKRESCINKHCTWHATNTQTQSKLTEAFLISNRNRP